MRSADLNNIFVIHTPNPHKQGGRIEGVSFYPAAQLKVMADSAAKVQGGNKSGKWAKLVSLEVNGYFKDNKVPRHIFNVPNVKELNKIKRVELEKWKKEETNLRKRGIQKVKDPLKPAPARKQEVEQPHDIWPDIDQKIDQLGQQNNFDDYEEEEIPTDIDIDQTQYKDVNQGQNKDIDKGQDKDQDQNQSQYQDQDQNIVQDKDQDQDDTQAQDLDDDPVQQQDENKNIDEEHNDNLSNKLLQNLNQIHGQDHNQDLRKLQINDKDDQDQVAFNLQGIQGLDQDQDFDQSQDQVQDNDQDQDKSELLKEGNIAVSQFLDDDREQSQQKSESQSKQSKSQMGISQSVFGYKSKVAEQMRDMMQDL